MKPLVAYYSLSGFTEKLASTTAAALAQHDVHLLKIVPARPYSYFSAGVRGVTEAMAGTLVDLQSPSPAAGASTRSPSSRRPGGGCRRRRSAVSWRGSRTERACRWSWA